jgi:hypothetical protein
MRGCLFVLVLAAALISGVAWFGAPTIADTVVAAALRGDGFRASTVSIQAVADPPPRLLVGQADRLTIDAAGVDWHSVKAARLSLTLINVDLLARSLGSIDGTIEAATLADPSGLDPAPIANIGIDGPADAAWTTITVDPSSFREVVLAAVFRQFGVQATNVELTAPDQLRLTTPGATFEGTLVIDPEGSLALSTRLGTVTMLRLDPTLPIRLRSVTVDGAALRLAGVLDATALLRG